MTSGWANSLGGWAAPNLAHPWLRHYPSVSTISRKKNKEKLPKQTWGLEATSREWNSNKRQLTPVSVP